MTMGGTVFETMAHYISVPLTDGSAGILAGHTPMIGSLQEGVITCRFESDSVEYIAVSGGVVAVADNEVTVLAATAELAENIDIVRARKSEERARKRLEAAAQGVNHKRAEASLHRAMAREHAHAVYINKHK